MMYLWLALSIFGFFIGTNWMTYTLASFYLTMAILCFLTEKAGLRFSFKRMWAKFFFEYHPQFKVINMNFAWFRFHLSWGKGL